MKNIYALVIALCIGNIVSAQWQHTNSLFSAGITAMASNGNDIFAAGEQLGITISTDEGITWSTINTGFTPTIPYIRAIAISGTNIITGCSHGIYLSSYNVVNWAEVDTGFYHSTVYSFAVSGINIFVGFEYVLNGKVGVYRSTNNGATWTSVSSGLPNTDITSFAVSGTNIFAGTGDGEIFLTTNYGLSWSNVSSGITSNNYIRSLAVCGGNIFAGTNNGVFLTTNNGISWTAVNTGLPSPYISTLAVSGTKIFAGIYNQGVYLSTNNGTNWSVFNTGLPSNATVNSFAISGTNIFAGTTNASGVWKHSLNFCIPPTTQATTFTSSAITNTTTKLHWTRGNGDKVIVFAKAGSVVNADPIDSTVYYANAAFGSGAQIGTGNYVIYNGAADSVIITSLSANTTYYYAIYEYKDISYCYLKPALIGNTTTSTNCIPVSITTQPITFQSICTPSNNTSFTVIANGTPPITYQWQYNNSGTWTNLTNGTPTGAIYSNQSTSNLSINGIINASNNQYRCYITNCSGINNIASNTATLLVNQTPTTPVITQTGNTLTSNASTGNQWYNLTTGMLNGANTQSYNPIQIGDYFVIITLNGCPSDSSNIIYYDNTGISEIFSNEINIHPNPATDKLIIELQQLKNLQNTTITIYDVQGKLLLQQNISQTQTELNIAQFAKGVYILKVNNDKNTMVSKIMKE